MRSIDPIERWNIAISAGAVATSLAVATPLFATSLAVGAALEAANFRALRRSTQFLFWGVMPGQRAWAAVFGMRPIDPNAPRLDDDDPSWDRWNPWLARESAPSDEQEDEGW